MLRRKHCSAKTQALKTSVPYGSTKVDYLESSGTQLVIPNISTKDLSVEIDYTSLKITNYPYYQKIFGYWGDNTQYQILETANYDPYPNIIRATIFGQNIPFGDRNNSLEIQDRTKYKFDANRGEVSLNNIIYANDIDFNKGSENNPIAIFATYQSDNRLYAKANMRLHLFKSWKLKLLQTHLIPSIDKTGTPCMFDLVTRKNFYNAGTGQFIYHYPYPNPIPNVIPSNYTRIDYLESTGTQWIDSELCMDSYDIRICIKGQALQTTDKKTSICGYWSNYGIAPEECAVFIFNDPIKNTTQTQQIMLNNWFDFSINPFEVFTIDVSRNKNDTNVICAINGIAKILNGIFNRKLKSKSPETFILFGAYVHNNSNSSEVGNVKNLFTGRIWYTDLYKDGQLVLKFVPCLDPTGTPCMYDTATQTPYYNVGTGDFLYPSPTSSATYSMRRPQAEYAKMTDTGVRRLYHVPVDYEGSIEEYASENGFKLLNETESPNEEGKYYAFRWVETDTELMTEWYETEPPTDEFGQVIENNNEQQSATFNLRRPAPIDNTVYTNNAQWAKITDTGVHKIYHTPIGYEGSLEDYAIENGYKRLIETESPNEEGKYYALKWVETDDTLTTEWFEVDPPQEDFI